MPDSTGRVQLTVRYVKNGREVTNKTAAKAIKKLNGAKQLHDSLYHQDVVGLEQEYEDKCTQYTEREVKIAKVVPTIKARGIKVKNNAPKQYCNSRSQ